MARVRIVSTMTAAGYVWRAWCEVAGCEWVGPSRRGGYGGRARALDDGAEHERSHRPDDAARTAPGDVPEGGRGPLPRSVWWAVLVAGIARFSFLSATTAHGGDVIGTGCRDPGTAAEACRPTSTCSS